METFYKLFFDIHFEEFHKFLVDAKSLSSEEFYKKHHKIIGHPYYMMRNYDKPQGKYLSYLDFNRLAPHLQNEDYLFIHFATSINYISNVHWAGTYIDVQVKGVKRLMKTKLDDIDISYDKKDFKNQLAETEKLNPYFETAMQVGHKFLLLEKELYNKHKYQILYLIRRSAFIRPHELPDTSICYFIAKAEDVAFFKTIKSETYTIYDNELFENLVLVDKLNAYCIRFSNPLLPFDLKKNWNGFMSKIKAGTYPFYNKKGNMEIQKL